MIEVEMKFPLDDVDAFTVRLAQVQPTLIGQRDESDEYFQAPDRDFAATDEALRIRRVGDITYLTYKGPKLDAVTKTRKEVQIRLDDGPLAADLAGALLRASGYEPALTVVKSRQVFAVDLGRFRAEVCLDRVQNLGDFVEIEVAAEPGQVDEARRAVQSLAETLGLSGSERRSYLELLLAKRSQG
ncbi:MAG: class IV adenylate cyclase [Gemmatales bacterium]|nr:class IV adenylate cyclase [Gemmatales bacterium]MDW8385541.1 class IV adenylate cyclase [Gemmatales bacterium]